MDYSAFLLKFLPLVIEFLKWKSTSNVVLFHCYQSETVIGIQTVLSQYNIYSSARALSENDSVSVPAHKLGILLNTPCDGWDQAFKQFDPLMFQPQFIWLIATDNIDKTIQNLINLQIPVNSDVTIACKNGSKYELYEVYKTGLNVGSFRINSVGCWDSKLHLRRTERRDLTGITMKCPVVVAERIINETFDDYLAGRKPHIDSLNKLKFYSVLLYLKDMYNYRQCFILRHPKHPGSFFSIYTRPLTARVWYCILAMFVVTSSAMAFILKLISGNNDSSTSLALLFTWSANCQQGMSIDRKSAPVKILVLATFVYSVTLYQYYNAAVVSTLLREPPKNIRTLTDLLRSGLRAGAEDVVYVKDFFKRTTDPIALQMYHKRIMTDGKFLPPETGMALVKRGGFAFHVDSVVAYRIMRRTFTEREICEAHEIPMYPPQKMGVIVPKRSPYKEHFTYGIRKMLEAGLLHRLRTVWDEPKPHCVRSANNSLISVSIREFSMALVALCVGMVTAVIVLAGEIIWFRLKAMNQKQKL